MATATEIITRFRESVDDQLDATYELELLNDAKNEIEAEEIWLQLLKETTYTVTSGYAYTSALGALPTRFALDSKVTDGNAYTNYEKVDFDDLPMKQNNPLGYFIDLNGGNLHLSGSAHSAKTLYFYYTEYSADLTAASTWVFPTRFHDLLALKMSQIYYASDAGEKGRSWDDRWAAQYAKRLAQMKLWNDSLKTRNRRAGRHIVSTPKSVR